MNKALSYSQSYDFNNALLLTGIFYNNIHKFRTPGEMVRDYNLSTNISFVNQDNNDGIYIYIDYIDIELQILSLHNTLNDLNELKINYNIVLSPNNILSINDICIAMIDRITANELLVDEISINIKPYCEKHGLNYEMIVLDYIKQMIVKSSTNFIVERGIILCKLIESIEIKTRIYIYIIVYCI